MPKGDKPTLKQRKFVQEYIKTGNQTEAAARAYNVKNRSVARNIGAENVAKPCVRKLLEAQAEAAFYDQIMIREELKESKKDYAVRARVNTDILDRAGFKPVDKSININAEFTGAFFEEVQTQSEED